jgi:hypothetical protein
MMELGVLVDRLEDVIAAFEHDPSMLARRDHDAMRIAWSARAGSITMETAYQRAFEQVVRYGLPDRDHYRRLFDQLLDGPRLGER